MEHAVRIINEYQQKGMLGMQTFQALCQKSKTLHYQHLHQYYNCSQNNHFLKKAGAVRGFLSMNHV